MAIGERIHFFRTLRGMTQKYLGVRLGFDEKSADVRIAQYESGTRSPKDNYIALLADTLGVSPLALSVPNIDSYDGLMHTLFALEDMDRCDIFCPDRPFFHKVHDSLTQCVLLFLTFDQSFSCVLAWFVSVS